MLHCMLTNSNLNFKKIINDMLKLPEKQSKAYGAQAIKGYKVPFLSTSQAGGENEVTLVKTLNW